MILFESNAKSDHGRHSVLSTYSNHLSLLDFTREYGKAGLTYKYHIYENELSNKHNQSPDHRECNL